MSIGSPHRLRHCMTLVANRETRNQGVLDDAMVVGVCTFFVGVHILLHYTDCFCAISQTLNLCQKQTVLTCEFHKPHKPNYGLFLC